MEIINSNLVEWGVAERRMPGETLSGDLHLVKRLGATVLFAVADGLGHGAAAAEAARAGLATVEECADEPLVQVLENCNQRLRESRGVVLTMALYNPLDSSMEWVGVGNIEGILVRSMPDGRTETESLVSSSGVVGGNLPSARAITLKIDRGDTLVLATDGIRHGFEHGLILYEEPQKTAEGILRRDGLETDDALVLVAKFQGGAR